MDIKVGEYVRINDDFRLIALGIGKVVKINQDTIYVKMNFEMPISFKIENIAKHSKNIIDLIEVGDIVNGYKILEIEKSNIRENGIQILIYRNNRYEQWETIFENEIEIMTKEQYMQNCYKCVN